MSGKEFGLNYKLGALQAGLGIGRIDHIKQQLESRRSNANYIVSNIKNKFIEELKIVEGGCPNYYSLVMKMDFDDNSEIIKLLEQHGIPSDIGRYNYKVLYDYPVFKKYKKVCPNSEILVKNITTVPVHPALTNQELEYIIDIINNLS
jgi:dTDP-4-amino-4,6-dideoxygalactose transaminase